MSSARKKASLAKAHREIDHLKQKLMMTEHHYEVLKHTAQLVAQQYMELKAKYEALERSQMGTER